VGRRTMDGEDQGLGSVRREGRKQPGAQGRKWIEEPPVETRRLRNWGARDVVWQKVGREYGRGGWAARR